MIITISDTDKNRIFEEFKSLGWNEWTNIEDINLKLEDEDWCNVICCNEDGKPLFPLSEKHVTEETTDEQRQIMQYGETTFKLRGLIHEFKEMMFHNNSSSKMIIKDQHDNIILKGSDYDNQDSLFEAIRGLDCGPITLDREI